MSKTPFFVFRVNFTDASISDIHNCVNVYTSCQYDAFFTRLRAVPFPRGTARSLFLHKMYDHVYRNSALIRPTNNYFIPSSVFLGLRNCIPTYENWLPRYTYSL